MVLHISLCSNFHITDDNNGFSKISFDLIKTIAVFFFMLKVAAIVRGIEVLRWCCARLLFGSQILVTTEGFEL